MMEKQEAADFLNGFIETAMSAGYIKKFAALDKLREAVKVLNSEYGNEKKIGEGAETGETGGGIENGKLRANIAAAIGG